MDHLKTNSSALFHKVKHLDGLMKLPLPVSGMLAHSHVDERYVHCGLDIYSHDANYSVGSFAYSYGILKHLQSWPLMNSFLKTLPILCMLHNYKVQSSRPTFGGCQALAPYFKCPNGLMLSVITRTCLFFILVSSSSEACVPWSVCELHARWTYTWQHRRHLCHWSMPLHREDFSNVPLLMKFFMKNEMVPTILHLIQEVLDFKNFFGDRMLDGDGTLMGHTKGQQFKFYVDSTRCNVMKYKIFCHNNDQLSKEDWCGIKVVEGGF